MLFALLGAIIGALSVFIGSHKYATRTPFYNLSYSNYSAIQKVLVYLPFLLFALISAVVAFYILFFSIGIIFASLSDL